MDSAQVKQQESIMHIDAESVAPNVYQSFATLSRAYHLRALPYCLGAHNR